MIQKEASSKEAQELAETHWKWLEALLHKVYVDAMIHGFGHGAEQQRKEKLDANKVDPGK